MVVVIGESQSKKEGANTGFLSWRDFCRQNRKKDISDYEKGMDGVGE